MKASQINAKINLRMMLQNSIIQDGIRTYGGVNNATVSSSNFKNFVSLKANYLVTGLDQLRVR